MSEPPISSKGNGSDQEKSDPAGMAGLGAFVAVGSTIAACVGVGVLAGLYVDRIWNVAPGGLLLGIVLGTVAAVASVVKLVRRFL